jgi:hypothetical protein
LGGSEIALVPGRPEPSARLTLFERIEIARSLFDPVAGETNSQRIQRLKKIVEIGAIEDPKYISDHWSRGVWEGKIEQPRGRPDRTLVIATVRQDGSAVGGWSYTDGKFGPGAVIKVDDRKIVVMTLPGSQVTLVRTRPDQLSGSFVYPGGTPKRKIVLNRK